MYTYCLFYADYLHHVYLLFTFYFVDSVCHRRQVGRFPYVRRGTCGGVQIYLMLYVLPTDTTWVMVSLIVTAHDTEG